jgi:hypothetical protein
VGTLVLALSGEPPCLGQVGELFTVQQLVPQPAEEQFRKTGLPGSMYNISKPACWPYRRIAVAMNSWPPAPTQSVGRLRICRGTPRVRNKLVNIECQWARYSGHQWAR